MPLLRYLSLVALGASGNLAAAHISESIASAGVPAPAAAWLLQALPAAVVVTSVAVWSRSKKQVLLNTLAAFVGGLLAVLPGAEFSWSPVTIAVYIPLTALLYGVFAGLGTLVFLVSRHLRP